MPFFDNASGFTINGATFYDVSYHKAAGDCGVNVVPGSNLIISEQRLIFSVLTLLSVRHITQLTVLMLQNVTRERV